MGILVFVGVHSNKWDNSSVREWSRRERNTKMSKGTAIKLAYGASLKDAIQAVKDKYATKRLTAGGWMGTAVVNVEAGANDGENATTFIVKALSNGWEVYKLAGRVMDEVVVTSGEFEEV